MGKKEILRFFKNCIKILNLGQKVDEMELSIKLWARLDVIGIFENNQNNEGPLRIGLDQDRGGSAVRTRYPPDEILSGGCIRF